MSGGPLDDEKMPPALSMDPMQGAWHFGGLSKWLDACEKEQPGCTKPKASPRDRAASAMLAVLLDLDPRVPGRNQAIAAARAAGIVPT